MNYSHLLIEHLVMLGVRTFCLAPGSRSSSLALAIARYAPDTVVHFDERGLAFYALGLAKGARKAVALLVTSGTAVGNLFPAVMEASQDHIPLILITADRPAELRDCSANQTTDQIKLFANFVRFQADLPLSDPAFSTRYLASIVSHALFCAQAPRPGPVHLNCMVREPCIQSTHIEHARVFETGHLIPSQTTIQVWADRLAEVKKGWIILGALPHDVDITPYLTLAQILGWPIYADVFSQCRTVKAPPLIAHMDLLAKTDITHALEGVLHFGGRTLSKAVHLFLQRTPPPLYLHISECPTLLDPDCIVTHRLYASDALFAKRLCDVLAVSPDPTWLSFWQDANAAMTAHITSFFSEQLALTEPSLIRQVALCTAGKAALFLANSMPVRDADAFLPTLEAPLLLFGNRGVSGIDGNIATAAGIAHGLGKPLIALLGDLAFLHDMNALTLLKTLPLCLIIINNQGGGIFSFLDVSKETEEIFEKYIATAHTLHFAHAAALFELPYTQLVTHAALETLLDAFIQQPRSMIIEVCTDRKENARLHIEIAQFVKEGLHAIL